MLLQQYLNSSQNLCPFGGNCSLRKANKSCGYKHTKAITPCHWGIDCKEMKYGKCEYYHDCSTTICPKKKIVHTLKKEFTNMWIITNKINYIFNLKKLFQFTSKKITKGKIHQINKE